MTSLEAKLILGAKMDLAPEGDTFVLLLQIEKLERLTSAP
jgi:hypothetical protein